MRYSVKDVHGRYYNKESNYYFRDARPNEVAGSYFEKHGVEIGTRQFYNFICWCKDIKPINLKGEEWLTWKRNTADEYGFTLWKSDREYTGGDKQKLYKVLSSKYHKCKQYNTYREIEKAYLNYYYSHK